MNYDPERQQYNFRPEDAEAINRAELHIAIDRVSRGERVSIPEIRVTGIITDADQEGLLELYAREDGGISHVAKLTDVKHLHTTKGAYPTVADKMVLVSADFDRDGNYSGISIDMTDFEKGMYRLHTDGTFTTVSEDGESELGVVQRRILGARIDSYCLI